MGKVGIKHVRVYMIRSIIKKYNDKVGNYWYNIKTCDKVK